VPNTSDAKVSTAAAIGAAVGAVGAVIVLGPSIAAHEISLAVVFLWAVVCAAVTGAVAAGLVSGTQDVESVATALADAVSDAQRVNDSDDP
jgi:hypothetical protein